MARLFSDIFLLFLSVTGILNYVDAATLKITKVPDSPVYVEIGKVLKLDISYEYDGTAGIQTNWKKNGSDTAFIRRTANGDILGNVDNRASITDITDLVLNNITLNDNTTFEVLLTATDSLIQPDETIQVIVVQELPVAHIGCTKPTNITRDGTVVCDCKASKGIPTPWVTWYDNGNKVVGSAGYGSSQLSINNIQLNQAGVYKCEAKIGSDFDHEDSVTINVQYTPENVKFGGKIAYIDREFTLTCSAEGFPTPTYTISHKETELVKDSTSGTYTIDSVEKSDAGKYTCVAKNTLGNITTSITVEVSGGTPPTESTTGSETTIPSSSTTGKPGDSDGLGTGAIVGIVVGVLALIAIAILLWYCCCCRDNGGKDRVSNPSQDDEPRNVRRNEENTYEMPNKPPRANQQDASPAGNTLPIYSQVDKSKKTKKAPSTASPSLTYAALDPVSLQPDSSKMRERPVNNTEYATLDLQNLQGDFV